MPRPRPVPAYRRHSRKDQAVVDVYRMDGKRTKVYLPGPFGSEKSKAAYTDLLARLAAHGGFLPATPGKAMPEDLKIDELILRFLTEKVSVDYVDADGKPTTEQLCYRSALKPLSRLFGWALARDFDARALSTVRESPEPARRTTRNEADLVRVRLDRNRLERPPPWHALENGVELRELMLVDLRRLLDAQIELAVRQLQCLKLLALEANADAFRLPTAHARVGSTAADARSTRPRPSRAAPNDAEGRTPDARPPASRCRAASDKTLARTKSLIGAILAAVAITAVFVT